MTAISSKKKALTLAATLGALALLTETASSDIHSEEKYFPAAKLSAGVASTKEGLAATKLPTGANATVIFIRRDKDGEVEVHDGKEDVLVAQHGAATLLVGGRVEGHRQTEAGEWRGGRISGHRSYALSPGDVIWIPAGIPHQLLVKSGRSFEYLALKFDAKPAAISLAAPQIDEDGAVQVPAFTLPESSLLDEKTRAALAKIRNSAKTIDSPEKNCPSMEGARREQMAAIRRCQAEVVYRSAWYKEFVERYPIVMTPQTIGGIYTEVFTPKDGISPQNRDRVLINLHGGHFMGGSRTIGHLESSPIASKGKIKVISVDYRQAPEYTFPAASEDVAAVYREVLKTYQPKNIGIYGCSAGGLLTAESVAWLQKEKLPLPGAVAMFGGAAAYYQEGDTAPIASVREGFPLEPPSVHPYFKLTDARDPLAFPIHSQAVMAKFPPSLLIASSRDLALSSVVHTHSQLVKLGVDAELHVWEGLGHCFYFGQDVPEAADVHDVTVKFFARQLGK